MTLADELAEGKFKETVECIDICLEQNHPIAANEYLLTYIKDLNAVADEISTAYLKQLSEDYMLLKDRVESQII